MDSIANPKSGRGKVILTKMVVFTISGHVGPVHLRQSRGHSFSKGSHLKLEQEEGAQTQTFRSLHLPVARGWGGGLSREGEEVNKFGMSLETQGKQTSWWDIPRFLPEYAGWCPKSLRNKARVQVLSPFY